MHAFRALRAQHGMTRAVYPHPNAAFVCFCTREGGGPGSSLSLFFPCNLEEVECFLLPGALLFDIIISFTAKDE